MRRAWLVVLALAACAVACEKKEPEKAAKGAASSSAGTAGASGSVAAKDSPKEAAPVAVTGTYDAKVGAVRVQEKGPAFVDAPAGGLGAGELTLDLPAEDGIVSGKASGAFGAQTVSGAVEQGRLVATVTPADVSGEPRFWGVIDATVEGKGDQRVVAGALRASNENGRVVRDAAFRLAKKK